jgi:hypothetical protein
MLLLKFLILSSDSAEIADFNSDVEVEISDFKFQI